jgi:hypothetical protein
MTMSHRVRVSTRVAIALTAAILAVSPARTAPQEAAAPAQAGKPVFPAAVAPKYASLKPSSGRMKTCLDQYRANKTANANGGMMWIQKGGGYFSACSKQLKSGTHPT